MKPGGPTIPFPFTDRRDAGQALAQKLERYRGNSDVVVLALPRGGVPVGFEVAEFLDVPLDVFLERKLGVPGHEELALGAIASGGVRVLNPRKLRPVMRMSELLNRSPLSTMSGVMRPGSTCLLNTLRDGIPKIDIAFT